MKYSFYILLLAIFISTIDSLLLPCDDEIDAIEDYADNGATLCDCPLYSTNPKISTTCYQGQANPFMDAFQKTAEKKCLVGACTQFPSSSILDGATFNFIVIGSGSGGATTASVLASLADEPTVLVLEVGEYAPSMSIIPGFFYNYVNSSIDWKHESKESPTSTKSYTVHGGRALGGSSAIDGYIYNRGIAQDYDDLAAFLNDPSWNYQNVKELFKSQEANGNVDGTTYTADLHGTGGEIPVKLFDYEMPIVQDFIDAAVERGYDIVDLNGPDPDGFSRSQCITTGNRRWNAAQIYLEPLRNQGNVYLALQVNVTKINLVPDSVDNTKWRAVSVSAIDGNNRAFTIFANREIISSAGVAGTTKLFMDSGIGPAAYLSSRGIDVKIDLPGVGQNVRNHEEIPLFFTSSKASYTALNGCTGDTLLDTGSGSLSTLGLPVFRGITRSDPSEDHPDLGFFFGGSRRYTAQCSKNGYDLPESIKPTLFTVFVVLNRHTQPGSITLKADGKVLIISNYFGTQKEKDVARKGIDIAIAFMDSDALDSYGLTFDPSQYPLCQIYYLLNRETFWSCLINNYKQPQNQLVGGCAMNSVVDTNGLVSSTVNLRAIDASVLPIIPNGPVGATIYMAAKKIASTIV